MSDLPSRKTRLAVATRSVALLLARQQGNPISLSRIGYGAEEPSLIIPRLYLGDYVDARDEPKLRSRGVTHILSILDSPPTFNFTEEYRASLKTLHIPIYDSFMTNILRHLDRTTEFISEALQNPNSVVLVRQLYT